ncbi:MAG: serine/threonine-protein kinase [Actinoplanes sp.]
MSERGTRLRPEDPSHIGAYELVGRLGSGGMGVVYQARARDGRPVAVKVVHAELAGTGEFRSRFRSEVARARQVPPFCTAEVLDADPDAERPYLVVEFVDGPSLAEEIARRGPLSAANLHGLAIGVATALAAIHEAGVIHRDLKPHNVLLAPGSPKVIDFGIAQAVEPTTQHTRTGEFVGTINYMAPERFGEPGTALSPAADVFAWGCVVAYAAQGRAPFDAESTMAIFARIMNGQPTLDGLSGPLRMLVQQALSAAPEQRPTARELVEALLDPGADRTAMLHDVFARQPEMRTAVHEIRAHPVVPPDRVPAAAGRRKRRPTALVAAVVVLALTLAAGLGFAARAGGDWWDTQGQDKKPPGQDPLALVLPSGVRELWDPLTDKWQWTPSEVDSKQSYCRFTDDRLKVQNESEGIWHCEGPSLELKGSFAVEVTARIELAGSCLAIWFSENRGKKYRLDACENTWELHDEDGGNGDSVVVREWPVRIDVGKDIRLQVVVQDGVARVGHDGTLVGERKLPEKDLTGGDFDLGVISNPADRQGPFRVSFHDIEVRIIR